MRGYVRGLSYLDAEKAVKLINEFAQKKFKDENLSIDERSTWENVSANISLQSVAVTTKTDLQIHEINVMLDDNNLATITKDLPYLLKGADERQKIKDAINGF